MACNCVISSHRIKFNTSIESSQQYLHFIYLHGQAVSNLRGHYDPKTEKNADFFLVTVSFLHIESSVIPFWKLWAIPSFHLLTLMSSEQFMRTLWQKNKFWGFLTVYCAVLLTISVLSGFSLKLQTNRSMLTFKVKVKFEKESFNSCLQL